MPASTPKRAVDAALARLRRVGLCLTDRPIVVTDVPPTRAVERRFAFAPVGHPAPLRARHGPRGIALALAQDFLVQRHATTGRFEVRTTAYGYRVIDAQERELLAFHWHPVGASPVTAPHLHLSSRIGRLDLGPGFDAVALGEMHLPTGFVTLADVVRLLITEFDIAPRRAD